MRVPYLNGIVALYNELNVHKQNLQKVLDSKFEDVKYIEAQKNVPAYFILEESK